MGGPAHPRAAPQVYKGYVDDPRNTDNAWIETVAISIHFPDQSDMDLKRLNSVWGFVHRLPGGGDMGRACSGGPPGLREGSTRGLRRPELAKARGWGLQRVGGSKRHQERPEPSQSCRIHVSSRG